MEKEIKCYCDNTIKLEIEKEYDISSNKSTMESIMNGSFQTATCPQCGKVLKPEFEFKLTGGKKDLYFFPELELGAYMRGEHKVPGKAQVAVGYPELMEKLTINDKGLDEKAIEYLKFQLLQKADTEKDVRIYYTETKDNKVIFNIHGLRPDEIGVVGVPFDVYEEAVNEVKKNPPSEIKEMFTPPYVSVRKLMF